MSLARTTGAALLAGLYSLSISAAEPRDEEQKTFYALGIVLARQVAQFDLTPAELALVKAGLEDGATDKATIDVNAYIPQLGDLQRERVAAITQRHRTAGQAFRDKAAAEKGATKTDSGIVIQHIKAGTGPSPTAKNVVSVHYQGRTIDGKVFDDSRARGEPASIPLEGVIPCWQEALQTVKVGGQSRIICPPDLAYGDRGAPEIPPGSTLVFDVELLSIEN